ncbi:hypothetical protein [Halococcus sp. IIIV-5B]|uniref:hypothetical protein n=1 Tax=Halococcus sp. IIIV-5B TaxID=2321230 RepID=UPI001313FFC1|nr:hypothetical protein [Halococcus sp. IIIV-5B]
MALSVLNLDLSSFGDENQRKRFWWFVETVRKAGETGGWALFVDIEVEAVHCVEYTY